MKIQSEKISLGFYFWTSLWNHFVGEEPMNQRGKTTSTATRSDAKSARQREKTDRGDNRGARGKVCVSDLSSLLMNPSLP